MANNQNQMFGEGEKRALRISKLIIDIGTAVLRQCLITHIKIKKYTDLKSFLERNQTKIQDKTIRPVFFFKELSKLYMSSNFPADNTESFDITLICKLFQVLFENNKNQPIMLHLEYLKSIRDENYAHVFKLPLKQKKYNELFEKLKETICEMCILSELKVESVVNQIDQIKNQPINDNEMERIKNLVFDNFSADEKFNKLFLAELQNVSTKVQITDIIAILTKNTENQSNLKKNFKDLFQLLTKDEFRNVNISVLNHLKELQDNISEIKSVTNQNRAILSIVNNESKFQSENLLQLNERNQEIIELIEKKFNLNELKNCFEINLNDFLSYFSENDSQFNFKILILDIEDYDKIDVEFFKTIAFTDWNLIIDLNPQDKMIAEFHNQLNFKKNFVKIHFSKEQNDLK